MLPKNLRRNAAFVKAWYYDKKLGMNTAEDIGERGPDISLCGDMARYSPTFYGWIQKMVQYLKMAPDDVFVDLGCGKGRVVFFVATHKLKKVVGVELDNRLLRAAQENLRGLKARVTPVELVQADAARYDLREATIIYMYTPFGQKTLEMVLGNLKRSLDEAPRQVRIVYYAPTYTELLDGQDWLIREGVIMNESCLVWRNKSALK